MTDPTLTFTAANGVPFRVALVDSDATHPSVKVMDARHDQWVTAYRLKTFEDTTGALCLDTGSPDWRWADTDVQQVQRWLRSQRPRTVDDAFVGRTADGLRLFISMGLNFRNGRADVISTEHETIPRPATLTVSGGTVRHAHDFESAGQVIDELRTAVPDPKSSWTQADLDSLVAIWDRWHLNTMRAGCVHQPKESVVYEDTNYGRRVDLKNTPPCPVTGYKYGSAWLAEPVPDDVLVEFHRLMDLPIGPAPRWLR